jgi:DNA-directed RNA polymerase specialized sigma24 family protein
MRIAYPKDASDDFQPSEARKAALVEAMRLHGAQIYGFLLAKTGDTELAKDLAQDTWLKVYRYFEIRQFAEKGLIFNKARQVFLDHQRAAKVRRIMGYYADMSQVPVAAPSRAGEGQPSEAYSWDEFWSNFQGVDFDPLDQKCFWLIYRYDYTIKEVSERVGMPISTLHDRVARLMETCREILSKEEQ